MEHMHLNELRGDVIVLHYCTNLQKVIKMSERTLIGNPTELISLDHANELIGELEVICGGGRKSDPTPELKSLRMAVISQ